MKSLETSKRAYISFSCPIPACFAGRLVNSKSHKNSPSDPLTGQVEQILLRVLHGELGVFKFRVEWDITLLMEINAWVN